MENQKTLLTISEVAKKLNVSRRTVHNWQSKGRFPNAFPVGDIDTIMIPVDDYEAVRYEEAKKHIAALRAMDYRVTIETN